MKVFQDSRDTSIIGSRVRKSDERVNAYGIVDELNCFVGLAIGKNKDNEINDILMNIQKDLFVLGSQVSNIKDGNINIKSSDVERLESYIKLSEEETEPLNNFVLPTGDELYSVLHICRSITRRAERSVIDIREIDNEIFRYLNRLSDVFFALARLSAKRCGIKEIIWKS